MKRLYKIFFVLMICFSAGLAQFSFVKNISKVGTTSAPFLEIEAGARAIGMGGAFVAVANDATALYWNVAGISRLTGNEAVFIHTQWLADINYDYAGLVIHPGNAGSFGVAYSGINMSDMEVRTIVYPEGTGELFNAGMYSLGLSYARNLTDRFSIGFTGKYIQEKIYHMSASAFALDIGTLFRTDFNGMLIGMSISNFGNKMRLEGRDTSVRHDIDENKEGNNDKIEAHLDTKAWSLPLLFRVGIAMDLINNRFNRLTIATDAMHPSDNLESMNVGFEYSIANMFFIRGGYNNLFLKDAEGGLSAGGGLILKVGSVTYLKADYAYTDFADLRTVHRFSLGLKF